MLLFVDFLQRIRAGFQIGKRERLFRVFFRGQICGGFFAGNTGFKVAQRERFVRFAGFFRGWQRRFVTSIVDEPFVYYEDSYQAVVNRVHEVAPSVRCLTRRAGV